MSTIEPGWYRDPAAPRTQRYWDGEQWVGKPVGIDETPPAEPEPLPPPPPPEPVTPGVTDRAPTRPAPGPGLRPPLTNAQVERLMAGRKPANPALRLVARLIDIMVVTVLNAVVNGWFVYQFYLEVKPTIRQALADPEAAMDIQFSERAQQLQFLILLITILVWFAYEVPATVKSGQTLGKRAMGITVVPIHTEKRRYNAIISRWSLLMLPLACFPILLILSVIDGLWCVADRPFRQCLHDKTPGTMVVLAVPDRSASVRGDSDVIDPPRS